MSNPLEAAVEAHLTRRVRALGGDTRKLVFPGRRGAPDRLVLLPGYHALVELKRPRGGVLAEHQAREHERLRAAGFEVVTLWSKEAVDAWLDDMATRP